MTDVLYVNPLSIMCNLNVCVCCSHFDPQEEEMSMLGEITHLQAISDDLKTLTMDPHKLPPSSEQVCLNTVYICFPTSNLGTTESLLNHSYYTTYPK